MKSSTCKSREKEDGVSSLVEYIQITGILLLFVVVLLLSVHSIFIQSPLDTLSEHAFVDIGNGMSTRIVDLYVISPYVGISEGLIITDFDIPDDVAGRGYMVDIYTSAENVSGGDRLVISGDSIQSSVSLAGIGSTLGVAGRTASAGVNRICYNSTGGGCPV